MRALGLTAVERMMALGIKPVVLLSPLLLPHRR